MKSQIIRLLNNKLSIFMFSLVVVIPCLEIIQLKIDYSELHATHAFYLAGSSRGHLMQYILLWFLPLYFLLLGADNIIQDYKTGYASIIISKVGKRKYLLGKLLTSFLVSAMTMLIALLINFVLVSILFMNETNMRGLDSITLEGNHLFNFSIGHPYIADLLFGITASILAGLIGLVGASFSMFFRDQKYAYAATFIVWFMLVLREDSLMFLFQPFAEYGFDVLVPIATLSLAIFIIIPFFVYLYEVKYNDA